MGHECAPRAGIVSWSSLSILIFAFATAFILSVPPAMGAEQFPKATGTEKCLTCHDGIERIGDTPLKSKLTCTNCHKGNPEATGMLAAHKGMYANPSDFRVVKQTCGACHAKETENMMHSLHATSAGVISGTRYAWGAQDRHSKYATYDVEKAGSQGPGTVKSLKQLPSYDPSKPEGADNTPVDDYLRNQCLRCHLWSKGHERTGDYRASGCAACHMVYSDNGKYEGGDQVINKDKPGRPRYHRITKKIPAYQCNHCHNRGARTGPSFIGTMESAGYGTPWTPTGGKQGKLHGQNYNHLQADVHYQRGMTCIDCHTPNDVHGDGNIYAKRQPAIEIECEDCHGTIDKRSNLKTSRGRPLTNLKKKGKQIILLAKLTGKEHTVPQLADRKKALSPEGYAAMVAIPSHMKKLECYACHAIWAPQCYGCHAKQDIGKPSGDYINTKKMDDPSQSGMRANRQKTAYDWQESRSYLRWETPTLGINTEGKVAPFIPGCQVIFTQMNGKKNIVNNKIFKTVDGTLGIGHSPVQPHTISEKSRTCADCHMSRKAIGLGTGIYNAKDNGLPIDTELERIVDENGKQIQMVAHEGARPFNKEEQQRITRVGTCLACHGKDRGIWKKKKGKAPTDQLHNEAIRAMTK